MTESIPEEKEKNQARLACGITYPLEQQQSLRTFLLKMWPMDQLIVLEQLVPVSDKVGSHFVKKDIKIDYKYMKICFTCLVFTQIQIHAIKRKLHALLAGM